MMIAAQNEHSNVVEILLQYGASVDIQKVVSIIYVLLELFMFSFLPLSNDLHLVGWIKFCEF